MDELLRAHATAAGEVFTAADALRFGHDARSLRRLVAAGECVRVGRGRYAVCPAPVQPEDAHLVRTREALLGRGVGPSPATTPHWSRTRSRSSAPTCP